LVAGVAWVVLGRARARQATPLWTVASRENIVAITTLFSFISIEGFLQSPSVRKNQKVERALLIFRD
jgi:hypothetical protein